MKTIFLFIEGLYKIKKDEKFSIPKITSQVKS